MDRLKNSVLGKGKTWRNSGGGSLLYSQSCWRYSRKWNDAFTILFKKDEELKSRFSTSSVGLFFFLLKCTVNRTWSTECSFISTSEFLHTCASSQKSASLVSGASKILTGSYQHKWEKGGLDGFGTFALNKQIWRGGAGGGCRGLPLERKPGPHKAASHEDSRGC